MKTITEFDGFTLKRGIARKAEIEGQGKTAEETPALLTETFRYEGDKLKYFMEALEISKARGATAERSPIKRVIVLSVQEGEKVPQNIEQREGVAYAVEFFPAPPQEKRRGRGRFDGKKGGGGKGRKKGRRGGGRADRDQRPHKRRELPGAAASAANTSTAAVESRVPSKVVSEKSSSAPVESPTTKS